MTRILRHLKSNAVAYVALFVALGGTSYAAIRIPARSVGNRQLKNHSVSANKLDRSSIAGYVRAWATIDSATGQVFRSRPAAHTVDWRSSGPNPGGRVQWSRPISPSCFALATTGVDGPSAYAEAEVVSTGSASTGGAYVNLSGPAVSVNVAVLCPQR